MGFVVCMIEECISTCFEPMRNLDDDFKFLDMFNNSINSIANEEVNCYERFVASLNAPGRDAQLPIDTEFYLLREIKDIMEELRMMYQIFDDQQSVVDALANDWSDRLSEAWIRRTGEAGRGYMQRLNLMKGEAERTNNAIISLMDLRQRHATLSEAQATGRQGNTIMVFTIVTILFLPASFMASFFALPVAQFARDSGDNNMDLTYIVQWLLAFTIPVAAFFISSAIYINEVLAFLTQVMNWLKKAWMSLNTRISKTSIFQSMLNTARRIESRFASLRGRGGKGTDPDGGLETQSTETDEEIAELASGVRRRKGMGFVFGRTRG
ncbi:hypothetical protein BJX99DRAFT_222561 [Aspergillus californicus]